MAARRTLWKGEKLAPHPAPQAPRESRKTWCGGSKRSSDFKTPWVLPGRHPRGRGANSLQPTRKGKGLKHQNLRPFSSCPAPICVGLAPSPSATQGGCALHAWRRGAGSPPCLWRQRQYVGEEMPALRHTSHGAPSSAWRRIKAICESAARGFLMGKSSRPGGIQPKRGFSRLNGQAFGGRPPGRGEIAAISQTACAQPCTFHEARRAA